MDYSDNTLSKSTLEDFEVISELGKGSFGVVYKVRRKNDNIIYALKKVFFSKLKPKEKENSLNEIRILASINNKNIVQYKDAFYDNDKNCLCLVMEFAEKGDLEKKIFERAKSRIFFSEYEILSMLIQITRGLKNLHDNKIMHRDIKSANIFIFNNDIIKIGDLNVSKILKSSLHHTQTGTPYYASPEVWENNDYDFKSDIWSLGCLLYEITCLKAPFRGNSMKVVYEKVKNVTYDPIPKQYSKSLAGLIYICLQSNPKNRPTCRSLLRIIYEKVNYFNLCGRELRVFEENEEQGENIKEAKMYDIDDAEDCQDQLLNTIKMPKRAAEINQLLPKNRYSSSASKRIRKSLLSSKAKFLPKLHITDLKTLKCGKGIELRNRINQRLKQNFSEANIMSNHRNKNGSKYNNLNYFEVKETGEANTNNNNTEIKEEIQNNSRDVSINLPSEKNNIRENNNDFLDMINNNFNAMNNVSIIEKQRNHSYLNSINNSRITNLMKVRANSHHRMDIPAYRQNYSVLNNYNNLDLSREPKGISCVDETIDPSDVNSKVKVDKLDLKLNCPINLRRNIFSTNRKKERKISRKSEKFINELHDDISKVEKMIENISIMDKEKANENISQLLNQKNDELMSQPRDIKKLNMNSKGGNNQKERSRAISAFLPRGNRMNRFIPQKQSIINRNRENFITVDAKRRNVEAYSGQLSNNLSNINNISGLPTIEKSEIYLNPTVPNKPQQFERSESIEKQLRMPKKVCNIPLTSKNKNDTIFGSYKRNLHPPVRVNPSIIDVKYQQNKTNIEDIPIQIEEQAFNINKIIRGFKIVKKKY